MGLSQGEERMRLRAHANIVDMAEWRRVCEQQAADEPAVMMFVGFQTMPSKPDMFTPAEIEARRGMLHNCAASWQRAKANSAYFRKAFANLKLVDGKVVEEVPAETPRRRRWLWGRWRNR